MNRIKGMSRKGSSHNRINSMNSHKGKKSMKRRILFLAILSTIIGFAWASQKDMGKADSAQAQQKQPGKKESISLPDTATKINPPKAIQSFALTNTDGKAFNLESMQGKWTVLFFGYAQCPDVCPKTLAIVNDAWRALPQETRNAKAQFIFVSLDPKEDTPAKLKEFLNKFNAEFIGVTGDQKEIEKLSKSFNVYSWADPNNEPGKPKVIDHTASLMLVNPQGRFEAILTPPFASDALLMEFNKWLKQ